MDNNKSEAKKAVCYKRIVTPGILEKVENMLSNEEISDNTKVALIHDMLYELVYNLDDAIKCSYETVDKVKIAHILDVLDVKRSGIEHSIDSMVRDIRRGEDRPAERVDEYFGEQKMLATFTAFMCKYLMRIRE